MTEIDRDNDRYKNDKDMTGVLYGGVWGFWGGRCIIITTFPIGEVLGVRNSESVFI